MQVTKATKDGKVALASNADYADQLLGTGSLSEDEGFKDAVPHAEDASAIAYVDFDGSWGKAVLKTIRDEGGKDAHRGRRQPRGAAGARDQRVDRRERLARPGAALPEVAAAGTGTCCRRAGRQSRQNSLPSTSCITRHDSFSSSASSSRTRVAPSGEQPCALGLERGEALLTHEPGADPHVEVHPVLDDLALGDALEEQPRTHAGGVDAGERGALLLRRQRAVEVVPRLRTRPAAAVRRTPAPRTRSGRRARVRRSRR